MPITWKALAAEPPDDTPFLVMPYVPRGGIILLHGKYSTGKSPLTWELARCVGEGHPWFGHATAQARVLYLELDTPRVLIKQRLAALVPAENVWWEILPAYPPPAVLDQAREAVAPELVIVNTLRKCYTGTDIESQVPTLVYSRFQRAFPGAAIVFVHHDRKDARLPHVVDNEDESFAGSQAWINDAQVALHIQKLNDVTYRVKHTKSQVSALVEPWTFRLTSTGAAAPSLTASIAALWPTVEGSKTKRVREIARRLGVDERRVWEGAPKGA